MLRARIAVLAAVVAWLGTPAPAAAHTHLRASTPAAGATVAETLSAIRLTFTEAVSPAQATLALTGGGGPVTVAAPVVVAGSNGRTVAFRLPAPLAPGSYAADWRAASADGHVVHGTLRFTVVASAGATGPAAGASASTVAAGSPGDTAPGSSAQGDTTAAAATAAAADSAAGESASAGDEEQSSDAASPLPVAVRWAELMALLGMIGAVAFNLLVVRRVRGGEAAARVADRAAYGAWYLALGGAALSALTLVARLWLQSRALYGADQAFEGENLDALLTATVWGSGWILQAVATVAYFLGLMISRAPHGRSVGWLGAAVAALLLSAVPALSGHASAVEGKTAIAIVSDWVHVLGAGVWLGTLAALLMAGLPAAAFGEGAGNDAFARMVAAFSPVALCGAAAAGVTGVINSLFHVHAVRQLWTTSYGQALLVKLALLAVVAGLGFYNWRFVLPTLSGSAPPHRLRKSAGTELAIGVAVVLVTAVLVALSPPP